MGWLEKGLSTLRSVVSPTAVNRSNVDSIVKEVLPKKELSPTQAAILHERNAAKALSDSHFNAVASANGFKSKEDLFNNLYNGNNDLMDYYTEKAFATLSKSPEIAKEYSKFGNDDARALAIDYLMNDKKMGLLKVEDLMKRHIGTMVKH